MIAFENPKMTKEQRDYLLTRNGHAMTWSRYHRYSDMVRYAEFLVYKYPQLVQLQTIGYTSGGLPIKLVKVSSSARGDLDPDEQKPAVWIDGGMHGREWITAAVVMYMVRQLVEHYEKNKKLVDNADWYLLPVANPDSYEYTHSRDRLWTKTRSDHENSAVDIANRLLYGACEGVNMDNNFDYRWGEEGSSDDPCNDFYAGPRAGSEPETKAITDFLLDKRDSVVLYISLHSYAQQWLLPWSFSKNKGQDDKNNEMVILARRAVNALSKVAGTNYGVISKKNLRAPNTGSSEDWAKGTAGIKYSYRLELRDTGGYGYLTPATEIIPTAKEAFAGIKAMARQIVCKNTF